MLRKLKMLLMTAALIGAAFLMIETMPVHAATERVGTDSGFHTVLEDDDKGIGVKGSSGVTELDNAAKRTNSLINWICGWFGAVVALFGFIWAAMNQAGHNVESRNMGIIVCVVGIVIAFAPKIVNFILGNA